MRACLVQQSSFKLVSLNVVSNPLLQSYLI